MGTKDKRHKIHIDAVGQMMRIGVCLILLSLSSCFVGADAQTKDNPFVWPKVTHSETRPWTWWWWHGCDAEKESITTMLEQFHNIGLGGVNIVCVNDVVDSTKHNVDYLSKEYIDLMRFAISKARSMGMDADISPVGGWAFGGKFVPKERSCSVVEVHKIPFDAAFLTAGKNIFFGFPQSKSFNLENLQSVLVVSKDGSRRFLATDKVSPAGTLQWDFMKADEWDIFATCNVQGSSKVRAATPDWRGYVINHLNKKDVEFYFSAFDKAFAGIPRAELPRAYNNDSWEINLDWTKEFFDEFKKRRGYDLQMYMPEFIGFGSADTIRRVTCDYRETLSDLILDVFTPTFKHWAKSHDGKIIGEVQFEPANEIDVNSLYDIPQADMGGGLDWYFQNGDYVLDQLFMRAKVPAASAHILGKPFVSSETYTCMGNLGTPLNDVKMKTDVDFIAGINNTCYHGITYSPNNAHWPGWLFYAGTQLGPFNPQWRNMKQLSDYITRNQIFLQKGRSDNDVLFYFPMHDEWSIVTSPQGKKPGKVDMSNVRFASADMPTTHELWKMGIDFDFVTDNLLARYLTVKNGIFVSPANQYKAIVISNCNQMPISTLKRLISYAEQGGTIVMIGKLPESVPGLHDLSARQKQFDSLMHQVTGNRKILANGTAESRIGRGRFIMGDNAEQCCLTAGIQREKMMDRGLRYIRRSDNLSRIYFIVNLPDNKEGIDGWIPLSTKGKSAVIYDAMTGKIGKAAFSNNAEGSKVYLQLKPNQSCIVRVFDTNVNGSDWNYFQTTAAQPTTLKGNWNISFIAGGEGMPHPEKIDSLTSWTDWQTDQDEKLKGFSGTARYETTFDKPADANRFILDLGKVNCTATVFLNGEKLGELISQPMQLLLNQKLKEHGNKLTVEVSSSAINRTGDLQKRGVKWFYEIPGSYDIEFNIDAKTFVPQKSGLLGPVRLIPIKQISVKGH